jgi:serine/threonine protein phosphatase 1
MTYVVSNIHGCFKKFKKLIKDISLKDTDTLYVLGDILDYGDEPIELLCDLSMRYNVIPIVGEHDLTALRMLSELDKMLGGGSPDPEVIGEMTAWIQDGGSNTMEGFKKLDADMREGVIDYLSDMSLYEELEIKGRKYLLVHAGIADFDPSTPLEDYCPEDFISEALDKDRKYFDDVTVIVGHTPTYTIDGATSGKIFKTDSAIFIDCGAAFDEALGCLRLEDGKEFYVS